MQSENQIVNFNGNEVNPIILENIEFGRRIRRNAEMSAVYRRLQAEYNAARDIDINRVRYLQNSLRLQINALPPRSDEDCMLHIRDPIATPILYNILRNPIYIPALADSAFRRTFISPVVARYLI